MKREVALTKRDRFGGRLAGLRAEYSPAGPGMSVLCGHLFGGAGRAVVLVRVGFDIQAGGAGGPGDAGDEPLGQLGGIFQGGAGVALDVLEGGERTTRTGTPWAGLCDG